MTNKQKKILITSIVTPLAAAAVIPSMSIAIAKSLADNSIRNKLNNKLNSLESQTDSDFYSYSVGGKTFDSKEELLTYYENQLEIVEQEAEYAKSYIVRNDPNIEEMSSTKEVDNYVNKKITKHAVLTSKNISTNAIGEIKTNDFKFAHKYDEEDPKSQNNIAKQVVYRGKNNSIHKSEQAAKDSYFERHTGYFYKDIYFNTWDELSQYLERNQSEWFTNPVLSSIIIKAPNGQESQPIQLKDLQNAVDKKDENGNITEESYLRQYIKNFVYVNSTDNIEYKKEVGENQYDYLYFSEKNMDEFLSKGYYSPNYVKVYSNSGKGSYIFDILKTPVTDNEEKIDYGEINGPYFARSSSSLKTIRNNDAWRETNNQDRVQLINAADIDVMYKFFNLILDLNEEKIDDDSVKSKNIFFNMTNNKYLKNKIDEYYNNLSITYPFVYQTIRDSFNEIKKGERYGSFYKIPILFSLTIDQLIYWGANQAIIDDTINIFSDICDYYDSELFSQIPTFFLQNKKKENISLKKLFGIGDKNLDINYDFQSTMTSILNDYPNILDGAKTYSLFIVWKDKLGDMSGSKLDIKKLEEYLGKDIPSDEEIYYDEMFALVFANNYVTLSTVSSFLPLGKGTDINDWNMIDGMNPVSSNRYNSFIDNWVSSLLLSEIIRYALTNYKEYYTEDQYNFISLSGFMSFPDNYSSSSELIKYFDNLEYMRELYEINNNNIYNLLFIILAIYNDVSNQSLRKIFGEPRKYDDSDYLSKILNKFQDELLYDVDKLIDVTNNLFTFNISSLPYYARMLDFCPWIDELSKEEGDVNTLSSDEKVYTISKFPPVHNQESEWKLETKEVDINGYPFIQAKQTKDGIKIQIPNPYSYSLPDSYKKMFSSDLTLEEKAKIISENAETILDPYFLSFFIDKTSSKIARTNPTQNNPVTLPAGAGGEPIYKNTPYGTLINGGKLEINDPTILHKYSQLTDNLALIDDNVLILNRNGDVSTHYLQNVMQTKQARLDAEIINDTTKPWAVREKAMTRQKFRAMRQRVDVEFDSINKDLNKISSDLRGNAQRIESVNADFKNKANQIKKQLDNGKITVTRHDEMIKSLRTQTNKELANLRTEQLHLKTTQTNLLQKYETDMTELKAFKANMTSRFQKFTKIFSVIGSALSWAMMAFMIWDLIKMFTVQRTPVSYTYDTGDVKLIWDGGWRESRFFGTQVVNSRGIDAGKILDPIQIVRPSKTSGLYYNGTIYPEGTDLRFVQTQDILKGKYKPSDIKTVYSFDDVTNQINPNRKYISYSKDELGDRVFDELKIWADSQKTRKNVEKPKFVYEHTWKDGIYEIVQNDFKKTIDNIRKNIRVVQIAYLPKVNESTNFPIFNDTLNEDESIPEYQLPGKTWDSEKNTVIEPSELPKFIVVDPNQPAYSSLDTDEKAINELRNQFQEKFSVPSKTIISSDLNFINKFSELESNIQSSYIYEAQGPRGDVRFFKEESDAIDWIWSSYGIQALYRKVNKNIYVLDNTKLFYSKQEYLNWILNNMEVIPWLEEKE